MENVKAVILAAGEGTEEFAREIIKNKRSLSNNPRLVTLKDSVGIYLRTAF